MNIIVWTRRQQFSEEEYAVNQNATDIINNIHKMTAVLPSNGDTIYSDNRELFVENKSFSNHHSDFHIDIYCYY